MTADIGNFDLVAGSEPIDLDTYPEARTFTLPPAGEYTVRAPDSFPDEWFGTSQAGALKARIDPTIVGPEHAGYTMRFTNVSGKPYTDKNSGKTVSQLARYCKAAGLTGLIDPNDHTGQKARIRETANAIYNVRADWRAYHRPTNFEVKGMRNFPSDGNGGFQSYVEHPTEKDPITKKPLKVRANLEVTFYLSQTKQE